jgi:hypothetical protein
VDLISDPRLCGGEHEVTRHPAAQEGSTRAQEGRMKGKKMPPKGGGKKGGKGK